MDYQKIRFEQVRERVALLTFNRPESRNPISDYDTVDEIVDACHRVQNDDAISCLILTGAGSAFSAGGDIKQMRARNEDESVVPLHLREWYRRGIQRIPLALEALDVPIIAAVNGPAIGAGCDTAMMCDLRLASERALFGETFLNLGIIPGDGGSWFLTRQIGYQQAAWLTFSGKVIDATEALRLGMVLRVVPHDDLLPEALRMAETIVSKPPGALRIAKRILKQAERMNLSDFLDLCAANQALAHRTEDHKEAIEAFFEKRKAVFQGR